MYYSKTLSIKFLRVAFEKISYLVQSWTHCLYSRHLAATPSPPCSVPDRTPLRSRSPPPLSAIRRRGRFHSRFCLAGAARKTCNTSTPLCPTDRPTDRPTEGGAAFSASSTRPLACSCRSFLVSCHPRVKCFKKRARPPPSSSSSGYSFFARALPRRPPRWRRGCPPSRLAAAAGAARSRCNLYRAAKRPRREEAVCSHSDQSVSRVE